jgi:hypothetical protein
MGKKRTAPVHSYVPLDGGKSIIQALSAQGIELDQKLREALRHGYAPLKTLSFHERRSTPHATDSGIFLWLAKLNAVSAQYVDPQKLSATLGRKETSYLVGRQNRLTRPQVENLRPNVQLIHVLNRALHVRIERNTLGTRDFLLAVVELCLKRGENYSIRPLTADLLAGGFGGDITVSLSNMPEVESMLRRLEATANRVEDFQYFVALEEDRVVFRVASTVGDVFRQSATPARVMLAHFKDRFGGFTVEEIDELEELLNERSASEIQFQRFFVRHPHFLRLWDHREVHPQVMLTSAEHGPLIPDFILTDRELQRALVLELKLPHPKLIVRQSNRERFGAAIHEARAQLLRYRDWFRDKTHRDRLAPTLGMHVFEPRLAVIIGRSEEFRDALDRQRLAADITGVEIYTYDDILRFAKRRRLVIAP